MSGKKLFNSFQLLLLLLIMVCGPGIAQAACLTGATPIGHWQLDENSPTVTVFSDISGNNIDGSCTTCPTQGTGQISFGQDFAGDEIDVPDNALFDFGVSDNFSFAVWVKRTGKPSNTEVILGRYHGTSSNTSWWIGITTNGTARFKLRDNDNTNGSSDVEIEGTTDITADGNWHHIVAVRDGASNLNLLYVDGVLENSASNTYNDAFPSDKVISIGYSTSGSFDFNGSIDEVAIFGTALSAANIRRLFLNGDEGAGYCQDLAAALVADTTEAAFGAEIFWTIESAGNPLPITFGLGSNAPQNMSIGANDGQISWAPLDTASNPTTFDATADNGVGSTDTASFSINLTDMCTAANLVGYFKLEEDSPTATTFVDASDTNNNGTCSTCPTRGTGQINFGQIFSSDEIDIPDNDAYDFPSGSFAVEVWMKRNGNPSGNEVVVSRYDANSLPSTQMSWWVGVGSSGQALFSLRDRNGPGTLITGTSVITDDNFHHIVAVRDDATGKNLLYVDGELEISQSVTYDQGFAGNAVVTIGYQGVSPAADHFGGTIDEVAIYNRALTATMAMQHAMLAQGYCNTKPVIDAISAGPATEDQAFSFDLTASDSDGDTSFTWSLTNTPGDMAVDASTGEVTWTPGEVTTSGTVTAHVSDSVGGTDTETFTIAVTNVNDAPVITTTAPTTAEIGTEYTYDADATDGDAGDTLTWSKVSGPTELSIDSASGLVTWTPAEGTAETTNVTIMVSDGTDSDTEDIVITVTGGSSGSSGGGGSSGCFISSIN